MMRPLATYLRVLHIRSTGAADRETPRRSAPSALLNEVGGTLGCAPAVLADNSEGILQGCARIPLRTHKGTPTACSASGRRVAVWPGIRARTRSVTGMPFRPERKATALASRVVCGRPDAGSRELAATAGRGDPGARGAVRSGRMAGRDHTPDEIDRIAKKPPRLGPGARPGACSSRPQPRRRPPNDVACGRDVRGHSLIVEGVREVPNITRRLTALLLLGPALEADDVAVKSAPLRQARFDRGP
jgi:hypothetical protein